jgi:hypothetical protein
MYASSHLVIVDDAVWHIVHTVMCGLTGRQWVYHYTAKYSLDSLFIIAIDFLSYV